MKKRVTSGTEREGSRAGERVKERKKKKGRERHRDGEREMRETREDQDLAELGMC